jgi:hypothetical protein
MQVAALFNGTAETANRSILVEPAGCETHDPIIDTREFHIAMKNAWQQSGYNLPPSQRHEIAGWIYQNNVDGSLMFVQSTVPSFPGWSDAGPVQVIPGYSAIGIYHTHPHKNRDSVYGLNNTYMGPAAPYANGRGSPQDWDAADSAVSGPVYVMNPTEVARLDPGVPETMRKSNPNHWAANLDPRCRW